MPVLDDAKLKISIHLPNKEVGQRCFWSGWDCVS